MWGLDATATPPLQPHDCSVEAKVRGLELRGWG